MKWILATINLTILFASIFIGVYRWRAIEPMRLWIALSAGGFVLAHAFFYGVFSRHRDRLAGLIIMLVVALTLEALWLWKLTAALPVTVAYVLAFAYRPRVAAETTLFILLGAGGLCIAAGFLLPGPLTNVMDSLLRSGEPRILTMGELDKDALNLPTYVAIRDGREAPGMGQPRGNSGLIVPIISPARGPHDPVQLLTLSSLNPYRSVPGLPPDDSTTREDPSRTPPKGDTPTSDKPADNLPTAIPVPESEAPQGVLYSYQSGALQPPRDTGALFDTPESDGTFRSAPFLFDASRGFFLRKAPAEAAGFLEGLKRFLFTLANLILLAAAAWVLADWKLLATRRPVKTTGPTGLGDGTERAADAANIDSPSAAGATYSGGPPDDFSMDLPEDLPGDFAAELPDVMRDDSIADPALGDFDLDASDLDLDLDAPDEKK